MANAAVASAASSSEEQPNTTLYVKNLNTKTKKPELRRQLYALFSPYGKVIDIVATRSEGMRGQAFVVFGDLSGATAARRALEGFEFYERSLKIAYARSRSKATIVREQGPEALFDPNLLSGNSSKAAKVTLSSAQAEQSGREKKRLREEARQRGEKVDDDEAEAESEDEEDAEARQAKIRKVNAQDKVNGALNEEAEEEEEEEMEMSDSDDDSDVPGPAPPPAS
ncbi:unnamed protein product [Jaminaea pallidilutea]